ncbi:MAG: CHAD domain-containing protein [Alsobacter sp.]
MSRRVDLSPAVAAECARLRAALDAVPGLASPDDHERAIHAARRSIKWLRAILRLLGPVKADPARREVDDLLRELAQSLSRTRDLHAATATVLDLRRRLRSDESATPERRRALRRRLAALASEWTDRAAAAERGWRQQRGDAPALEVIEARILALGFSLDAEAIAREAARTYGAARRSLRSALHADDAEDLHAARTLLVRHQLQSTLLRSLAGGGAGRLQDLVRLRNHLGEHHDLAVAEALAGATPHDPRLGRDLARLVARRQSALVARCRPLVDALFDQGRRPWRDRLEARLAATPREKDPAHG